MCKRIKFPRKHQSRLACSTEHPTKEVKVVDMGALKTQLDEPHHQVGNSSMPSAILSFNDKTHVLCCCIRRFDLRPGSINAFIAMPLCQQENKITRKVTTGVEANKRKQKYSK